MKCPKCNYLGFETGDRCRNCGYDFSLLVPATPEPDLPLKASEPDTQTRQPWLEDLDQALGGQRRPLRDSGPAFGDDFAAASLEATAVEVSTQPVEDVSAAAPPAHDAAGDLDSIEGEAVASRLEAAAAFGLEPAVAGRTMAKPQAWPLLRPAEPDTAETAARQAGPARMESRLPLFSTPSLEDDQPLIKVPPQPRRPLSVRRTPHQSRWRAVSKAARRTVPAAELPAPKREPMLAFPDERGVRPVGAGRAPGSASPAPAPTARLLAAVIDHAILFSIDMAVGYFTLRMASLSMADWRSLPAVPMLAFLSLLKLTYFFAFTAVGGQTIGKMATGIRVVGEDGGPVKPGRAAGRTLAGLLSTLGLGLGFLMGLVGAERRALHDRLARTRVVALGL